MQPINQTWQGEPVGSNLWLRDLLAFSAASMRPQLLGKGLLPPTLLAEPLPAAKALSSVSQQLNRNGFRLRSDLRTEHAVDLAAESVVDSHAVVVVAEPFVPTAESAREVLASIERVRAAGRALARRSGARRLHAVLVAPFSVDVGSIGSNRREWIREFFDRNPRQAVGRSSQAWRELTQEARRGRPLRVCAPIGDLVDSDNYVTHWLGALAWSHDVEPRRSFGEFVSALPFPLRGAVPSQIVLTP